MKNALHHLLFFITATSLAILMDSVSVFYFHRVDPKYQHALDYAFKLDLLAIPLICLIETILLFLVFKLPSSRHFKAPGFNILGAIILAAIFSLFMQLLIFIRSSVPIEWPFLLLFPFIVRASLTHRSTRTLQP